MLSCGGKKVRLTCFLTVTTGGFPKLSSGLLFSVINIFLKSGKSQQTWSFSCLLLIISHFKIIIVLIVVMSVQSCHFLSFLCLREPWRARRWEAAVCLREQQGHVQQCNVPRRLLFLHLGSWPGGTGMFPQSSYQGAVLRLHERPFRSLLHRDQVQRLHHSASKY